MIDPAGSRLGREMLSNEVTTTKRYNADTVVYLRRIAGINNSVISIFNIE